MKGYFSAIISLFFSTLVIWPFRHILEKAHMGLLYLLLVAIIAARFGTRPATLAAVLSFLVWNFFFIPPVFTFIIYDTRDWLLLCVFLIIGIITGQITGQLKVSQAEAIAREKETMALLLERQRLMEETAKIIALRETERSKSVLFSSLSHNLKTPLSSLNAILSSLCQEDIEWDRENIKKKHNLMADDINLLTENIEKLLYIAQLESGSWQPKKEWFELSELISIAVKNLPESQYKRLKLNIPEELPLMCVDSVQFSQVIRHLVENALAYSPFDVEINASFDEKELRFYVDDHGEGIVEEEREKIFLKFYRGRVAKEKSIRGTGLGLAICHEIIQIHKGKISVEKSLCGGARFCVSLPLLKE